MSKLYHAEILPQEDRNVYYAIGNFDGLHKGHQAIIDRLKTWAHSQAQPGTKVKIGVITFSPHPICYFHPDKSHFSLCLQHEKYALFDAMGVDIIVDLPFTHALAQMPAQQFVQDVLSHQLGVAGIIVGKNFRFGHARKGSIETLMQMSHACNFTVETLALLQTDTEQVYSSTHIRHCLQAGNVSLVATMLGRYFSYTGKVQKGQQIGRTLGFPTVNIHIPIERMVKQGIYVVYITLADGTRHEGVGYVAKDYHVPCDETLGVFEAYIDKYNGDLYGQDVVIEICDFVRAGRDFRSQEDLVKQIQKDLYTTRQWFHKKNENESD